MVKLFVASNFSGKMKFVSSALGLLIVVLSVLCVIWGKSFIHLPWVELLFDGAKPIKLSRPQFTNVQLSISGRKLVISPGEFIWHGNKCTFNKANKVDIPPCPRVSIRLPLLDGKNLPLYKSTEDRWQSAIRRATIKCSPQYFIKETLVSDSVRFENAADLAKYISTKPGRPITNLLWLTGGEAFYGPDNMILINRRDRDFTFVDCFWNN